MKPAQYDFGKTFGIATPAPISIDGYVHDPDSTNPLDKYLAGRVPAIDSSYVFRPDLLRDINVWWKKSREAILLFGPTGSGKSSALMQICARIGIPVWRVTGHARLESAEIFGHYVNGENGQTVFMDGPATEAAKYGGLLIIDEADRTDPAMFVGNNGLLETGPFTLSGKGCELVHRHQNFRIALTANSNMAGDDTGNYLTAMVHDKSIVERIGMAIEVGYMADEEKSIVEKELAHVDDKKLEIWFDQEGLTVSAGGVTKTGPQITRNDFIEGILKVRDMIRKQSRDCGNLADDAIERTMSTRVLARWVASCANFQGAHVRGLSAVHYAMERALTNTCTASTKIAIHGMVKAVFGVDRAIK